MEIEMAIAGEYLFFFFWNIYTETETEYLFLRAYFRAHIFN